jgi:rhodanese-related sulfurtransferase
VKSINPEDFIRLYEKPEELEGALVLDVRSQEEWDYYHLERSVLMPVPVIPEGLHKLPVSGTIYVVCAHGIRSEMICRYLEQKGFPDVINVEGGLAAVAGFRGFAYD